ncbi:MICOS complex subunit Mic60-like [Dendroctonus ponderosae]|uniref:MICOS complex subunit MIC60 n=1 Tax=Dendroctonus ponderosae TaxID=77166 RepID=A0AAR5PP16_DENPD|nr:MICOS complex subunit Mic60-like [Dendroctonus ponderosae]KAH1014041.1 hypothetical protein HUJ04_002941 [Dendroctonus ponderosae]KAH1024060.1 hypothetical protein HUJ05_003620 [Dendroctonus ponderosae]
MYDFLFHEGTFYGIRTSPDNYKISFQQAPILWTASQAVLESLKTGSPECPTQIKCLQNEISVLVNAISPHDQFARTVLRSLPTEAWERGIFSEEALKKRFSQVEKIARKVDLVPAEGASLVVHILSYLQDLFLINPSRIPQAELNDDVTDFTKMNSSEILYRAKFWLDHGNLLQTLKYMNLLKGAPRSIATQWMYEAKILLETQQAVKILIAYAACSGLNFL